MPLVKLYNCTGKVIGEQQLDDAVFGVSIKEPVVQQAVVAQHANARTAIAHTKTRSEVSGGGRKPWKQKGTGRARHGSIRSPLWRGGGITFGPRNTRNFSQKINKKAKVAALRMVLSDKVAHDKLIVIDQFAVTDAKTKELKAIMGNLPVNASISLLVMGLKNDTVIKAARNLKQVGYIAADSLNIVDLLKYEYIIVDQAGIDMISKVFGK